MKTLPGFPNITINTIYCIGRNYARHAAELGNTVPEQPMVFLKPVSSIIGDGEVIQLPTQSNEVHHEVELVVAIDKRGKDISREDAFSHIGAYGIGIDVTARDIQQQAKDRGHPWSVAKGFDTFAPISQFHPVTSTTDFSAMELSLTVNEVQRQHGFTRNMIFPVEELVSYLSSIFTLTPGDLIFTGTPEGVSEIKHGDKIEAVLGKQETLLRVSVERNEQ